MEIGVSRIERRGSKKQQHPAQSAEDHNRSGLLAIEDLSIRFGGLCAVDGLSFEVRRGEVFALIGPNGAGKTTVFNCISGLYRPDSGEILFQGASLVGRKPFQIARLGIARTFQNMELFRQLTVLDNLLIALHKEEERGIVADALRTPGARREERRMEEYAWEVLEFLGMEDLAGRRVDDLPYGLRKKVELARGLALKPSLLLLDEPVAGMNAAETRAIGRLILRIREERGVTVVLVEHDMRLVMDISDRICVLNFGRWIAEGPPGQIKTNPEVVRAYLG